MTEVGTAQMQQLDAREAVAVAIGILLWVCENDDAVDEALLMKLADATDAVRVVFELMEGRC